MAEAETVVTTVVVAVCAVEHARLLTMKLSNVASQISTVGRTDDV